jgi:hypothetical protein
MRRWPDRADRKRSSANPLQGSMRELDQFARQQNE